MSTETSTVRFDRLASQGIVYGLDKAAFITLLLAVFVGVGATLGQGFGGLLLSALVWGPLAVLAVVKIHGQPLITHLGREIVGRIRKMLGATIYRRPLEGAVAASMAEVSSGSQRKGKAGFGKVSRVVPVSSMDIPGRAGRLFLYECTDGSVVLWDAKAQTATISAIVATPGLGMPQYDAPSTLSADERQGLIYSWAQVLGSLTHRPHIDRIAVIESTRPGSVAAHRQYAAEHMNATSAEVAASYEQALDQAQAAAVVHLTKLAITFSVRGDVKSLVKANGGGVAGVCALAQLEMSSMSEALSLAGFSAVRWETSREWGAWGRAIIDPASQGMIDVRCGSDVAGVDPVEATPMLLEDHRSFVESDSAVHRTWWINQWPRYDTYPGFLSRLVFAKDHHGAPVRHTFALVASPVPVSAAMKRLEDEKRTWITNDGLRAKAGKPRSQADEADWLAIEEHEAELVAGQGELRFSAYVTTSAPSLEELERSSASIATACSSAGLEPRRIVWQQGEALMNIAYPNGMGIT